MAATEKITLILKTGGTIPAIARELGDFEDWISDAMRLPEAQFLCISVFEGEPLPDITSLSSIVVTGSPAMMTQDLHWIRQSQEYLLEAIEAELPVLGICFGHQLLAHALGGKVDWHPAGREIGTTNVRLTCDAEDDELFADLIKDFPVHTTHMQTVTKLPAGARVLASNQFEAHHALRFRKRVWGVQFHPEFDASIMRGYIEARSEQLEAEGLSVNEILSAVESTPQAAGLLKKFAEYSRLINSV